jgi:hypothetical protein
MVIGFRLLTLSGERAAEGMCLVLHEECSEGIARKYYVSPGIGK